MGELFINANGGGGISDDMTAKKNDVLKGKTAVTADSDDEIVEGTLELTGNASTENVEVGKTFYNTNAHSRQTGALRNATNDTSVKHAANNTTKVIKGDAAYVSVNTDGVTRAEIRFNESRGVIEPNTLIGVPQNTMAKAGGLTEGKLLKGQSAFGLTGTATGDATSNAGDILSGKTAYVNGNKVTGTMANQGAKNTSLNAGGSYTIPAGYHNGKGKVTANSLSSQTGGNAVAADVLKDKTAWVNGNKVTGTMADRRALNTSIGGINNDYPGVSVQKASSLQFANTTKGLRYGAMSGPTGFYENGTAYVGLPAQSKTVTPSTSQQTVRADGGEKILESVTVNAIPNNRGQYQYGELGFGTDYYAINQLPEGYYVSNGADWAPEARITKTKLQNGLGVTADKIKMGESIADITGTFTSDANAGAGDILKNKTAYVNGNKITGTMNPVYIYHDYNPIIYEGDGISKTSEGSGMTIETFYTSRTGSNTTNGRNFLFTPIDVSISNFKKLEFAMLVSGNTIVIIRDNGGDNIDVQGYSYYGQFLDTSTKYLCGFFFRWKYSKANDSTSLFRIEAGKTLKLPFPYLPDKWYPVYPTIYYYT